jgi:hypothetical protein
MIMQNVQMVAFTAIASTVGIAYGVETSVVNYCVMIFFISFLVFNFFAMYALEWRKGNGVTICFKASALIIILGAWGKYFALS